MQAKHITEEPDVGKEVPTFLQNSLSSLKVPPPHPHPRHSHLAPRRDKFGEGGGFDLWCLKVKKTPLEVVRVKLLSKIWDWGGI